jgi:hypothetical protein
MHRNLVISAFITNPHHNCPLNYCHEVRKGENGNNFSSVTHFSCCKPQRRVYFAITVCATVHISHVIVYTSALQPRTPLTPWRHCVPYTCTDDGWGSMSE